MGLFEEKIIFKIHKVILFCLNIYYLLKKIYFKNLSLNNFLETGSHKENNFKKISQMSRERLILGTMVLSFG